MVVLSKSGKITTFRHYKGAKNILESAVLLSKSGKITTFRHYNCAILTFLIENVNKHTIFRTIFKALACEL